MNILQERLGDVLVITVNRPKYLNALNWETIQEIGKAIDTLYADDQLIGAIITGAGEKAFVAGADIKEFKDFNQEEGKKLAADGHKVFNKIENCPKPVIAAVNGFALGGGCELAMACHLRLAGETARFGQPEVNLGLVPGYGGTQRLTQLVGKGKALELLMTGDMINSQEAYRIGLVNHIVYNAEMISKAVDIIEKIGNKGPKAVATVIQLVEDFYAPGVDGFEKEIERFGDCFATKEMIEGTSAFIEKRKANYRA